MSFLLEHLNVPVVGYSLPPEKDSLFSRTQRKGAIPEIFADIRDYEALEQFVDLHKPSTIIHMAAQPLVLKSYQNPRETFDVNVMGTVNVLDIAFKKNFVQAVIVVTTDKVYRNDNSGKSFVESDALEGKDPYSASKVGTEAVVSAWQQIARLTDGPNVASVRAGNVIGGGDFAEDRLIPDLVRGLLTESVVEIRNPESTRPWQHVLDPMRGYLLALELLLSENSFDSLNFGPKENENVNVREVVDIFKSSFQASTNEKYEFSTKEIKSVNGLEASLLTIDSTKSKHILNWESLWSTQTAVQRTGNWWGKVMSDHGNPSAEIKKDIINFLQEAMM